MENPRGRLRRVLLRRSSSRSRPSLPLCWVYDVTVDEGGFFHTHPNCFGGPFRSFVEAATAIRQRHFPGSQGVVHILLYGKTILLEGLPIPPRPNGYYLTLKDGLFHIHLDDIGVGGPFSTLADATDAIQSHEDYLKPPPFDYVKDNREKVCRMQKMLPNGYYLTLKDGLFHIHLDDIGIGSPFSTLADATAAIQSHQDSLKPPPFDYAKDNREKVCRMQKMLSELDPADLFRPVVISQKPELHKYPAGDTDSDVDDSECDEALKYLETLEIEREAVLNGMRWMENDATQALNAYLSSIGKKGLKYEFKKLDFQCLIFDGPKAYHHYNFTVNIKMPSAKRWGYKSFFAEVKSTENGKHYFCQPLKDTDNGHCFGCRNVGIKLRHPANGGYEEGNVDSGFPFDIDGGV